MGFLYMTNIRSKKLEHASIVIIKVHLALIDAWLVTHEIQAIHTQRKFKTVKPQNAISWNGILHHNGRIGIELTCMQRVWPPRTDSIPEEDDDGLGI